MQLHTTIIYLIGIPAVGKYTVARELGRLTGAAVSFDPNGITREDKKASSGM